MIPYVALFGIIIIGGLLFSLVSTYVESPVQEGVRPLKVSTNEQTRRKKSYAFTESRASTMRGLFRFVKAQNRRRWFNALESKLRFKRLVRRKKTFQATTFHCSRPLFDNSTNPRVVDTRLSVNENKKSDLSMNLNGGSDSFPRRLSQRINITSIEKKEQIVRLCYCLIVGFALISLCGFRAVTVGFIDNVSYAREFYRGNDLTFHDVINNVVHPDEYGYDGGRDFTFYILSSFMGKIFPHHQYFFYVCAILSLGGYVWLIYRYSVIPSLSFLLFVSVGHFLFSMTGIRQAIALGICCFSYKYIVERKLLPFVLIVFLSSLFHKTSIVFFPAYWLYSLKLDKKVILAYLLGFIFVLVASQYVNTFFLAFSSFDSRIESYMFDDTKLTYWGFVIHFVILAFCCLGYNNLKEESDKKYVGLYLLLGISVLGFLYDVVRYSIFFRLVMYYSLYEIILIPRVVQCFKNNSFRLITLVFVAFCCVFYFFQGITGSVFYPYLFFWEDNQSLYFN